MDDIFIRTMLAGEEAAVSRLVLATFMKHVAPAFSGDGVAEFRKYANPDAMAERGEEGNIVLVAEDGQKLVGMIEIRDSQHICFFFTEHEYQNKGIGAQLLEEAERLCTGSDSMTVNSSPNAVKIYEAMGFSATGPEQTKNGIRFIPMRKPL